MTQPLTDAITALTRYANETTGASDQTLSDAVRTLCDGYGGGGGNDLIDFIEGNLTVFESDEITVVRHSGFASYINLTEISLPNCISLGMNAFHSCTNLTKLFLPKVENLSVNNAFYGITCPLVLTSCKGTTYNRLTGYKGSVIDLGLGSYTIGSYSFNNCSNLKRLILRQQSLPTLENINGFVNTPFASNGTGGTLYVPQDLISSYQSASNWSTILGYANNSIQAIEGSEYEHYYADGTPIE